MSAEPGQVLPKPRLHAPAHVLLKPCETAERLKVSLSWLAKARMRGDGPPFIKKSVALFATATRRCCSGCGRISACQLANSETERRIRIKVNHYTRMDIYEYLQEIRLGYFSTFIY